MKQITANKHMQISFFENFNFLQKRDFKNKLCYVYEEEVLSYIIYIYICKL